MQKPRWGSSGGAWSVTAGIVPEPVDTVTLRQREGRLTQEAFARRYGFSPSAVRDWEQRRRTPDVATRIVLAMIDRDPEAVRRVLGS